MSALRRHLGRLKKHVFWISLAILGLLGARAVIPTELLKGANDVGGNFLQTFGGIYGIIVAFAMYVVWGQHNETQTAIEREAVSLGELHRVLGYFRSWPKRDAVRKMLFDYALDVPRLYAEHPHREPSKGGHGLDAGIDDFLAYRPADEDEVRLHDAALGLFHELNEARERRLTIARIRLPDGLRWFVFLGAAITVATMWLVWIDSAAIHAAFTAGLTWVVVAAASIVVDLDDPFTGDFVVNWHRFEEAARRMEAVHCPPHNAATSK